MKEENTPKAQMESEYLPFVSSSRLLYANRPTKDYQRTEERKTIFWEIRRNFLSDLQFFTYFALTGQGTVIYFNPYPALHVELLSKYFPDFTFHLYDSRELPVEEVAGKIIKHSEFKDEEVAQYAGNKNLYFIALSNPKETQTETLAWSKLQRLETIVRQLDPTAASIGFRLPYPQLWKKMAPEGLGTEYLDYLKGYAFFEPWTGYNSAEVRLVPLKENGSYRTISWDISDYDGMLAYHNTVERESLSYLNVANKSQEPIDPPELLTDYDSTYEAYIWQEYLRRYTNRRAQIVEIRALSRALTKDLVHLRPRNPTEYQGKEYPLNSLAELRQAPLHTTSLTLSRPVSKEKEITKGPLSYPPAVLTTIPSGEPVAPEVPIKASPAIKLAPLRPRIQVAKINLPPAPTPTTAPPLPTIPTPPLPTIPTPPLPTIPTPPLPTIPTPPLPSKSPIESTEIPVKRRPLIRKAIPPKPT